MGLDISLGMLAAAIEAGDAEQEELARADLAEINSMLTANGLPPHAEPERMPNLVSRSERRRIPYSWLHYLRRAVAFARQAQEEFTPTAEGERPARHPLVDNELSYAGSHLICHSDCDGFYVPIDFPEPLYDDRDSQIGAILGSSQQALKELVQVAPLIGIALSDGILSDQGWEEINNEEDGPLLIERKVWLLLFERFTHSIEYKAVVSFH